MRLDRAGRRIAFLCSIVIVGACTSAATPTPSRSTSPGPTATPQATPTPSASPTPEPPASWLSPADGASISAPVLEVSARIDGEAPVGVTFNIAWEGQPATFGCSTEVPGTDGTLACTIDLEGQGVPGGPVNLSFVINGPDGTELGRSPGDRTISFAGAPGAWGEPTAVDRAPDCRTLAAAIDDQGRRHVASGCDGGIRYSTAGADGPWSTTVFEPAPNRREDGPQLAFDGGVLYLAFTRIAVEEGGCGDDGLRDRGVFIRQRSLPDGAWSDAFQIGEPKDRIDGLRVVNGTIHAAIVADDGAAFYETARAGTTHRYPIPDGRNVSIRVGGDGRARIGFARDDGVWYGEFGGSTFATTKVDGSHRAGTPQLVLDAANRAHMMWIEREQSGGCAEPEPPDTDGTYYGTNAGGRWTMERVNGDKAAVSFTLDVMTGQVHAVTVGDRGLHELTRAADGTWTEVTLAKGWVQAPVIRQDPATGRLLVVYLRTTDGGGGSILALTDR